jgi:hypothetical protein
MSNSREDRKRMLKDLNQMVGPYLKTYNVSMLSKLSEGFYKEVQMSKECASHKDAAGAELHKIIAEYIHDVSSTFEAIRE